MEELSESYSFRWYVHNPFLPVETKEATFCLTSPKVTLWKATLQRGQGKRRANYWPVSLSLQYLPPDGAGEDESLETAVSVDFLEVGNELPRHVTVVFNGNNNYTYTYDSSIRPEHGRLEIDVDIRIPYKYKETLKKSDVPDLLENLSRDLNRLWKEHLYYDMRLQSSGAIFRVHSYILSERWPRFYRGLEVQPDGVDPPTVITDIPPYILYDILTYLYTGYVNHFHLHHPSYDEYRTELLQTMDRYPLCHLYMLIEPDFNCPVRITKTDISSTAMTFILEKIGNLGFCSWTHSPLPGVSVTTALRLVLDLSDIPSISYTLRFTNAMQLSARVNLEYRRKVIGWDSELKRILYEGDHEIPANGIVVSVAGVQMEENLSYLLDFLVGRDRRERSYEVEHSLRFILYLSRGEKSEKIPCLNKSTDEELSFSFLSRHMSQILSRQMQANLHASPSDQNTVTYRLHKGIFLVRIPRWWNLIEEVPDGDNIPDRVTILLESDAFPFVIEYLYTGKCSPTPENLLEEIEDFARHCGFSSLEKDIRTIYCIRLRNATHHSTTSDERND